MLARRSFLHRREGIWNFKFSKIIITQNPIVTMTTTPPTSPNASMEMDAPSTVSTDTPFSLELLSEPLLSFTKEALTANAETAANKYNVLEAQLRRHLLSLLTNISSNADAPIHLEQLHQEWNTCWNICLYILQENSALGGFIRKLPFCVLEDVVECLSSQDLETFYSFLEMSRYSTGILWSRAAPNTSHILQYIRLQNALLHKLPKYYAGTILMEMSHVLSLSDKSALKLWGSVSGRTMDEYDEDDEQEEQQQEEQQQQEQERTFHDTFWSVQHDMQNPYKIQFAHFFTCCKQILAALESNHNTTTSTTTTTIQQHFSNNSSNSSTDKYLTKRSLLPLQLQDATFLQHWLTQFLILPSFFSWQSTQLATTLQRIDDFVPRLCCRNYQVD